MIDEPRTRQLLELLAGRWMVPVLSELREKGRRYQDLDDAIEAISHKVLTDTVRRAERDGLIARQVDPGRIETATLYELTQLGRSLDAPMAALGEWVQAHWSEVEGARHHWSRRGE